MPKREDIHTILVIGSGPIVIGQACEFDYSGTQGCKALREEGYRVVLVNSNPATIMTDPETADRTYVEPMTLESIEKIIDRERPDVLLPTLGDSANPPPIRIRYRESGSEHEQLDIAQSGAGLHTFLSLAQLIRQSTAKILLLDEPDSHLHASQQNTVVQLLSSIAVEDDRQVILATHSPETRRRLAGSRLWSTRHVGSRPEMSWPLLEVTSTTRARGSPSSPRTAELRPRCRTRSYARHVWWGP